MMYCSEYYSWAKHIWKNLSITVQNHKTQKHILALESYLILESSSGTVLLKVSLPILEKAAAAIQYISNGSGEVPLLQVVLNYRQSTYNLLLSNSSKLQLTWKRQPISYSSSNTAPPPYSWDHTLGTQLDYIFK